MRVLIADDHPLVADAFTAYLQRISPDVEVTHAATLAETLRACERSPTFDLILLDLQIPDVRGLEGLSILQERFPDVPVVLVSGLAEARLMREALGRGALGVIPKDLPSASIIKALELVLTGERFVPARLLDQRGLRESASGFTAATGEAAPNPLDLLSDRQCQVLALLVQGHSNREIARDLGIKEITVAFHLKGIFRALDVRSRAKAAVRARALGWTDRDTP